MQNEIQKLEEEWATAELSGDVTALDSLLADDFVAVGPLGFTLTKRQWLDRYASGDLSYRSLTWDDVNIRVHGPAAVAVGVQTQEATYKDRPVDGRFRVTQVFVNEDGRWLVEGLHLSPIAAPPAP